MGTTVVIPQRDRGGARLWNCLNALARQTVPPEEVVVSDLSSATDHLDNIRGITRSFGFTFLRVEWRDPRFSRAASINCGIRVSRSRHVVVLDVDAVAAPHFVETYEARLRPNLMLMCEHRRGREAAEGEDLSSDWGAYFASSQPNPWSRCANGMSMGAERALWAAISGVDERFVGWGAEDDHAVWKADQVGDISWIDDPLIIHQDHPSAAAAGDHHRNNEMFETIKRDGVAPRPWGVRKVLELDRG